MNKTVSASIGGFVFNIEEQAYETLQTYLQRVRQSLVQDESIEEIMQDIELRIAEIFQENLRVKKREVIDESDVVAVMVVMGKPEDYGEGEASAENENEKSASTNENRQFFRDPDNQVLGGVCSGLSSYFSWDPLFLRIIFTILFFGFGTGLLLYIVLWIIIPEAKTTTEKLKMKGEKINVENIKERVYKFKTEVENVASPENKKKMNDGIKKAANFVEEMAGNFYAIFGKVLGTLLIIFGLFFLTWVLKSAFSENFIVSINDHGITEYNYTEFGNWFFGSTNKASLVFVSLTLLFLVPFTLMVMAGFRLLLNRKIKTKVVTYTFSAICSLSFLCLIIIGISTGRDFVASKTQRETKTIASTSDTLILKCNKDLYFYDDFQNHHEHYLELIAFGEKDIVFGAPELNIQQSLDSLIHLEIEYFAFGKNQRLAGKRAQDIRYNFNEINNILLFDPYYSTAKSNLLRGQCVQIHLEIPEGKSVYLDPSIDRIICDIQNIDNVPDYKMIGRYWQMKAGTLHPQF